MSLLLRRTLARHIRATSTNLTQRTIRGMSWSTSASVVQQIVKGVTLLALASVVGPQTFGVMGMALVVTGFIETFNEVGTAAAIVYQRDLTGRLLSTVFWTNICVGLLAALTLFVTAPAVASFFHNTSVIGILRWLSLGFILTSLTNVQQALLTRDLAFRALASIEVSTALAGSVMALTAATLGAGVMSLVVQLLVTAFGNFVLLWLRSSWRPRLAFSIRDLRSIARFSVNLLGYNVINYLARNADNLLIGRYLGATALGYYAFAYNMLLFPLQMFTYAIGRVTFPIFASIQNDPTRIGRGFLRLVGMTAMLTSPVMFGLIAVDRPFIRIFYGQRWTSAVFVIAVLAALGSVQTLGAMMGPIYQAVGRTDLQLKVGGSVALLIVASFWVGLPWGIAGVAVAYAIAGGIIALYPSLAIPLKLVNVSFRDFVVTVAHSFLASGIMLACTLLLQLALNATADTPPGLVAIVAMGVVTYFLATIVLNRRQLDYARALFRTHQRVPRDEATTPMTT